MLLNFLIIITLKIILIFFYLISKKNFSLTNSLKTIMAFLNLQFPDKKLEALFRDSFNQPKSEKYLVKKFPISFLLSFFRKSLLSLSFS